MAAWLFVAAGTLTAVTIPLPHPPGLNARATFLVGIAAVVVGAITYVAPWERWPRKASLWLLPIAFALIGLGNSYASVRPYAYSVFFIVAFAWIGLAHPRWTSVIFAPLAAEAYIVPMYVRPDASRSDAAGALFAIPACVLVAEIIAWTVTREQRSRQSAHSLARVAGELGQHLDEERLSQILVDEARGALLCQHAVLFRVDPVSMTVLHVHASGVSSELQHVLDRMPGTKLESLPARLWQGDPVAVVDPDDDPDLAELSLRFGVKSFVSVPVMARGSLVAVLSCWETSRPRAYSDDDLAVARALAGYASTAIENARLYEKTVEASHRDPLTGLRNRRAFRDRLEAEIERSRRHGRMLSLVVLDCDGFKRINDTLGHQSGDRVLERIGELLQRNARAEDEVYRIGGDEFAAMLPETPVSGAVVIAERLRRMIERATLGADLEQPPLTASVGVATFGEHGLIAEDLFRHADTALYEAKRAGGNATALPATTTDDPGVRLGVDIERVIANEQIRLRFQPVFDLRTGRVTGFETLARIDPIVGHAPTPTLFRAAATVGKVEDLDRICRQSALRSAVALPSNVCLFINVAPVALTSHWTFAQDICTQIDDLSLPRERIVVEVTGGERSSSYLGVLRNLHACQHEGVRVGLDDFIGTPADLDLLSAIAFDFVKVDLSYGQGTSTPESRRAVFRALAILIRETGAQPIAKGIETIEDLRLVHDLGFFAAQGMFLREPALVPDVSPRPLRLLAQEPVHST